MLRSSAPQPTDTLSSIATAATALHHHLHPKITSRAVADALCGTAPSPVRGGAAAVGFFRLIAYFLPLLVELETPVFTDSAQVRQQLGRVQSAIQLFQLEWLLESQKPQPSLPRLQFLNDMVAHMRDEVSSLEQLA